MVSGKFFLVAFGSLLLYTLFIHFGYLNFMGNEIGQFREWDEKRAQDWDILTYPIHDAFHRFMKNLNLLYLEHPALYRNDYSTDGFRWIDCHQEERCIYTFERIADKERILAVFNLSGQIQEDYELTVEGADTLTLLLASDDENYAGTKKYTADDKKIKLKEGYVKVSPYWIILDDFKKALDSKYVGVIEVKNGEKFDAPHFVFFSDVKYAEDYSDEMREEVLKQCVKKMPRFQEVVSMKLFAL